MRLNDLNDWDTKDSLKSPGDFIIYMANLLVHIHQGEKNIYKYDGLN